MKITLVRHTSVAIPSGFCYGQTDVPVKDTFYEEAHKVKLQLKSITPPEVVFSSPLTRCFRLASYCGFRNAQLDDRIKELNFGLWEMQKWDDIDMKIWEKDWISVPPPNGESFAEMLIRVSHFFDELKEKEYVNVLVFTHGGVINCAKVYFGQTDIKAAFDNTVRYGSVVEFEL